MLALQQQLQQLVETLLATIHGIWRFRWAGLACAWSVSALGWFVAYRIPNVYEASALIYVDTQSILRDLVGDLAINSNVMPEINVLTRALLSRPNLEEVARKTDLAIRATTPQQYEGMLESLGSRINIERARDQNIFTIQYQDRDRETAEAVVSSLLETFISGATGRRRIDSGAAERFLDAQIQDYEKRLDDAERRLADFKRENVGLMPGERGDYYSRLQNAMAALEQTRSELSLADERRKELEQQILGEEPVFGLMDTPTTSAGGDSAVDRTIADYEERLAELRLKYTDNHPDIVALQDVLAQLQGRRPQAPVGQQSLAAVNSLNSNPVYQQMRISLSQAEVEVVTLRRKLESDTAQVEDLKLRVDTIPDIERQLAALDRDYEVTRDQHDEMLRKREELRISENVESAGDDLQFRILEPPLAPQTPIGPNRTAYLTGVFVVALGAGLFLALALSQLKAVISNTRELAKITGLPVLGSVGLVLAVADRGRRRRRSLLFAATAAGLLVSFVFVLWLQGGGAGLVRAAFS